MPLKELGSKEVLGVPGDFSCRAQDWRPCRVADELAEESGSFLGYNDLTIRSWWAGAPDLAGLSTL